MPGIKFATTAPAETVLKTAYRRAQDLGYSVEETGALKLRARKGNVALVILVGGLATNCDFRLEVRSYDDDREMVVEWSTFWWTGLIGARKTRGLALKLLEAIGDALEEKQFQVADAKEF